MTKMEAIKDFIESNYRDRYNLLRALNADRHTVQFEWDVYTDYLCKCGDITMQQYESWTFPWKKGEE